jgi:hypothetical protein
MMICNKCNILKNENEFEKKKLTCKKCINKYRRFLYSISEELREKKKSRARNYYAANKDKLEFKEKQKIKTKKKALKKSKQNTEKITPTEIKNKKVSKPKNKKQFQYIIDESGPLTRKEKQIINRRKRRKERLKNDPVFAIKRRVSNTILQSLKEIGSSKQGKSTWDYMPFTKEELKIHLETLFSHPDNLVPLNIPWHREDRVWMTWENWGIYKVKTWNDNNPNTWVWNLDHIIPQSQFRYASMEDQEFCDCWALSNLRPLAGKNNVKDGDRR